MSDDDSDSRFQLAAGSARRIVAQCKGHVQKATSKLSERINSAPMSTPCGIDQAAALRGRHLIAFQQRINHVESMSNGLLSHLQGLNVLLRNETFFPLPAIPIVRSIAETAASCSWILNSDIDSDARAARAYASLFRSIENNISGTLGDDADNARALRERLVEEVGANGVRVVRRVDRRGATTDQVSQVQVGRAHVKTDFSYARRVAEEIPLIAGLYSGMSGVTHGEHLYVTTAWDTPDTYARLIGMVAQRSVEAWSRTLHRWVGVQPASFINSNDQKNLVRSMPQAYRDQFSSRT